MTAVSLHRDFLEQLGRLENDSPFVFLYTVPLPDESEVLRVTSYQQEITRDEPDEDGNPVAVSYQPAPVRMRGLSMNADGKQSTTRVLVNDVGRQLEPLLEKYDGLTGVRVGIELCTTFNLDLAGPSFFAEISRQTSTESGSAFVLGGLAALQRNTLRWFSRTRCTHGYARGLCPIRLDHPNAPATCSKFLLGENGCMFHRQFQIDNGLEVSLPDNIGMQPWIAVMKT